MIDEDKLKKLLHEVVVEIRNTVMPNYYTEQLFSALHTKIQNADLTKEDSEK